MIQLAIRQHFLRELLIAVPKKVKVERMWTLDIGWDLSLSHIHYTQSLIDDDWIAIDQSQDTGICTVGHAYDKQELTMVVFWALHQISSFSLKQSFAEENASHSDLSERKNKKTHIQRFTKEKVFS